MKQRLPQGYGGYRQRRRTETGFPLFKRRLGSTVHGRTSGGQCREPLLMAITYNPMLLYLLQDFLQSRPDPFP